MTVVDPLNLPHEECSRERNSCGFQCTKPAGARSWPRSLDAGVRFKRADRHEFECDLVKRTERYILKNAATGFRKVEESILVYGHRDDCWPQHPRHRAL